MRVHCLVCAGRCCYMSTALEPLKLPCRLACAAHCSPGHHMSAPHSWDKRGAEYEEHRQALRV